MMRVNACYYVLLKYEVENIERNKVYLRKQSFPEVEVILTDFMVYWARLLIKINNLREKT